MTQFYSSSEDNLSRHGMWLVLVAAVLWGTTGTTQAVAPAAADPLSIGFVRIAFGALVLTIIAAWQGHLSSLASWRNWPIRVTLLASVAIAAYQIFFFAGLARTGVAVGTVVGIGSTPIAAGVLTFIVYRQFPGRIWTYATLLAILGLSVLAFAGGNLRVNGLGILLAIGAGTSYALYTLLTKRLLAQEPRGAVLCVTFMIGTFLMSPVLLLTDFNWLSSPRGVLVALQLGVITVGVAYQLYAMGLSIVPVATTATLTLAEPLTAGLLGLLVLDEQLSAAMFFGIALLFSGLILLMRQPPPPRLVTSEEGGFE